MEDARKSNSDSPTCRGHILPHDLWMYTDRWRAYTLLHRRLLHSGGVRIWPFRKDDDAHEGAWKWNHQHIVQWNRGQGWSLPHDQGTSDILLQTDTATGLVRWVDDYPPEIKDRYLNHWNLKRIQIILKKN